MTEKIDGAGNNKTYPTLDTVITANKYILKFPLNLFPKIAVRL